MTTELEVVDVECVRGDRHLFSGLSLSLQAGQIQCIEGANGAGKPVYYGLSAGSAFLNRGKYSGRGNRLAAKEQITAGTLHILGTAMALSSN